MSRLLHFDRKLLMIILGLLALGIVMIYSSSAVIALTRKGSPNYFFTHQALWAVIGIVVLLVTLHVDYKQWNEKRVLLGLMAFQIVLLVLALMSPAINGSHRWIKLGPITSFQPSETAKLVVVIYAAHMLSKRMEEGRHWIQVLLPIGIFTSIVAALIVIQPDLGTVVVLGAIVISMLFVGGLPVRWLGALAGAAAVAMVVLALASPYRRERIMTFLHPDADPRHSGFQANQSLIAVGSGRLVGKWVGGSSQKLLFLPHPHEDFIYAMIGEELGLVGNLVVLGGFLALGFLGLRAVRAAPDPFGAFLALGIVCWVVLQALIHMMVTLTLLPTKGLPLPLMSYGGSNLVVTMAALGILLNVSQHE